MKSRRLSIEILKTQKGIKVRYVFSDGSHSIYRLREVERGLLESNISMLQNGSSSIVRRDPETGVRDENRRMVYENDLIRGEGRVRKEHGEYTVKGRSLTSLQDIKVDRRSLL